MQVYTYISMYISYNTARNHITCTQQPSVNKKLIPVIYIYFLMTDYFKVILSFRSLPIFLKSKNIY